MSNSSSPTDTATPSTASDSITQLYASYLNRAPDPSGATYWVGQLQGGMSLDQIAQSFSVQTEPMNQYAFLANPDVTNTTAVKTFVDAIYSNLFNRAADAAGEAFWIGQLQAGAITVGGAVLSIVNGAQTTDALTISNKATVANYYDAQIINNNVQFSTASAQAVVAAATADASSVTAAQSIVDAYVKAAPHSTALASHIEVNVVGTSAGHHDLLHVA